MKKFTLSGRQITICAIILSMFVFQSCRKDRFEQTDTDEKIGGQLIKQEDILKLLNENPAGQVLSLDWKNAKQALVKGRKMVSIPTLNVDNTHLLKSVSPQSNAISSSRDNLGTKKRTGTSTASITGKNPNYHSSHPPAIYFVQDVGASKPKAYLLNFVPEKPDEALKKDSSWTGKLYSWNMEGDTLLVQHIVRSKLIERFGITNPPNAELSNLSSNLNANGKILSLSDHARSSFFGWLGDLVGDIVGWIGHTLGFSSSYYTSNDGYSGGWRINWGSFGVSGGGDTTPESIDPSYGTDIYGSYLPGYGAGVTFEYYPNSGPNSTPGATISVSVAYLISALDLTNTAQMDFLAANEYLSNRLAKYLDNYGVTAENKAFAMRAIDLLFQDGTKTYDDFKFQYIPEGTDVIHDSATGQSYAFSEIISFYTNNSGLMEEALAEDPSVPSALLAKFGVEKGMLIVQETMIQRQIHLDWPPQVVMGVATYYALKGEIHFLLQLGGLVPIYGEAFDILDGAIYFVDGDYVNAAFSVGAAVPFYGWVATGAKWTRMAVETFTRPIGEAVGKIAYRAFKNANGTVKFLRVALSSFSHSSIIALKAVKPADLTLTNLSKSMVDQLSLRLAPTGQVLKTKIDDIVANGDVLGTKTESICDDIFETNGFVKQDAKFGSNNGFDGVYIKKDAAGNVQEIIINEAKQIGSAGNIKLNARNDNTGLAAQMSDEWVLNNISKLKENPGTSVLGIQLELLFQNSRDLFKKTVTGIDRTTKEIVILRLEKY